MSVFCVYLSFFFQDTQSEISCYTLWRWLLLVFLIRLHAHKSVTVQIFWIITWMLWSCYIKWHNVIFFKTVLNWSVPHITRSYLKDIKIMLGALLYRIMSSTIVPQCIYRAEHTSMCSTLNMHTNNNPFHSFKHCMLNLVIGPPW